MLGARVVSQAASMLLQRGGGKLRHGLGGRGGRERDASAMSHAHGKARAQDAFSGISQGRRERRPQELVDGDGGGERVRVAFAATRTRERALHHEAFLGHRNVHLHLCS
jgi:hypothetical protein